jgi:small subunit ribosomal protein S8e
MAITQARSRRKSSGGRYGTKPSKKVHATGNRPVLCKVGAAKTRKVSIRGNSEKTRVYQTEEINIIGKDKKAQKVKIKNVVENPANRHFVRRNILTKGTVVDTEAGKVKITSRPGQNGTVNGVLI